MPQPHQAGLSTLPPFVVRFSVDFVRDRSERQVRAHFAKTLQGGE